ncbi:MAG: response regulator [Candidatus Saliniplasma sp.]
MAEKAIQDKKLYNILLVEDEEKNLRLLRKTLESAYQFDCNITTAGDGKEGLEYIEEKHYDIVLSDYQMPRMNGVDFLNKVKEKYSTDTVRFLITGHGDMDVIKQAINEAEIHQFIEKPWDPEKLRATIHQVMKRKEEREKEEEPEISEVKEAIETIEAFQKRLIDNPGKAGSREQLMFEFDSSSKLNNFSFSLKYLDNVNLKNIERDGGKYIIKVELYPKSYKMIS